MDSKIVNAELRKVVRLVLKKMGFVAFASRNAWRYRETRIEVINFWSFNSYHATNLGCTTYSYMVLLGSRLPEVIYLPNGQFQLHPAEPMRPREFECEFRRVLTKTIEQPEFPRKDIWFVSEDGSNLDEVVRDTLNVILTEMPDWFDRFADNARTLQFLETNPEVDKFAFGFGALQSPCRWGIIASLKNRIEHVAKANRTPQ